MKYCANLSLLFRELPLLDRFVAARNANFTGVEIQFPYEETLQDLQHAQRDSAMPVVLINVPVGDLMTGGPGLACSPSRQSDFKSAVDEAMIYAQGLNVECVNVLAGRITEPEQRQRSYDIFLRNLEYCADLFQSVGVKTIFEAINNKDMPNFLLNRCEQMVQVLNDLNHPNLGMQYDLYHMAKMDEPIEQQLTTYIDKIAHLQFADTPGRHEPGTGDLPFNRLIKLLRDLNYSHWLGAEYNPRTTTLESLDWMKHICANPM